MESKESSKLIDSCWIVASWFHFTVIIPNKLQAVHWKNINLGMYYFLRVISSELVKSLTSALEAASSPPGLTLVRVIITSTTRPGYESVTGNGSGMQRSFWVSLILGLGPHRLAFRYLLLLTFLCLLAAGRILPLIGARPCDRKPG